MCTRGSDVASNCVLACTGCTPPSSAVFTMTNAKSGNEVIIYARDAMTGRLSYPRAFSTGGVGGDDTLETAPDDPLGSQNSVIVADNCVLACNAGSNTISSFGIIVKNGLIEGFKRTSIVGSGGDLPVSIAYSNNADRIVYVLNAGGPGSISGFALNNFCQLEAITNSIVTLYQGAPEYPQFPFFFSTPAQIGFSPDSSELIVTIKGINGIPDAGGTITRFDVDGLSRLVSYPRTFETGHDGVVPFSFDFDDDGNLIVATIFGNSPLLSLNAGSVNVYNFEDNGDIFSLADQAFVGQTATCWVRYSNGCVFTSQNGSNSISSLRMRNGNITLVDGEEASRVNVPIDITLSPDGQYLYAISSGHTFDSQPRMYVYDVSSRCGLSEVQVMSDGLPNSSTTVFGVSGLAVF